MISDPNDADAQRIAAQFQIGDEVVYVPEGVITTVAGYVWQEKVGTPPTIALYGLACGISVPKDLLAVYVG
ncbi:MULTISPECIES: hypothetical protein [unclassified Mesorhizobium]|uniref:hypothetical protein n=1 Tax=unclassified Mesorhizobium TaxID=325217 RepID=UPI000FCB61DE|nr:MULTISPECIES: hypothetical protein [unclassified Mesorhizobium]RVC47588.1 hypothetical protein EN781_00180 [Mesorhizobium sp. M4A.F.Ca.ET.090.04.2.1]RWB66564.1 MAG: hypothetical protein EOQ49_28140 [Mesorhizobium sp.]